MKGIDHEVLASLRDAPKALDRAAEDKTREGQRENDELVMGPELRRDVQVPEKKRRRRAGNRAEERPSVSPAPSVTR